MGDQQARPGEVRQVPPEFGLHVQAGPGIQRRQRLVQQQQRRLPGQRARQRYPLRLPAGQLVRLAAREAGQPEPVQPVPGSRPGRLFAQAAGTRGERHVLGHIQVREQPVVLEHKTDRPARGLDKGPLRRVVHDLPRERDPPGGHRRQPRHRAQQGGLPRPVRPQHTHNLTRCRGQADREHETAALDLGIDDQPATVPAHHGPVPCRTHWSRRETSTITETSSSTRLSAIAASGSVSSA